MSVAAPTATRTWPLAGAAFLLGFGVADVTGVRALGGLVLLAGAVACGRIWLVRVGAARTAALLGLAFALFVGSHPLGTLIGAWPAVIVSAALAAAAAWRFGDRS